ncbi:hypothetical protein T439DRAFT_320942 [Meredithblackwellia eburnea MCA 4105]
MLGTQTKILKTYGKRKTNIVNKPAARLSLSSDSDSHSDHHSHDSDSDSPPEDIDDDDYQDDDQQQIEQSDDQDIFTRPPTKPSTRPLRQYGKRSKQSLNTCSTSLPLANKNNNKIHQLPPPKKQQNSNPSKLDPRPKSLVKASRTTNKNRQSFVIEIPPAPVSSTPPPSSSKNSNNNLPYIIVQHQKDSPIPQHKSLAQSNSTVSLRSPPLARRRTTAKHSSKLATASSSASSPSLQNGPRKSSHPALPKALSSLLLPLTPYPRYALDFESFVDSPPSPLLFPHSPTRSNQESEDTKNTNNGKRTAVDWRKVGEASYSEVFAVKPVDEHGQQQGEEIVVKIIPVSTSFSSSKFNAQKSEGDEELPFMSTPESVRKEVEMSQLVSGKGTSPIGTAERLEGFVDFLGAYIVQGSFPSLLLNEWDKFKRSQSPPCDDQMRPHVLPSNQIYALICLRHGGSDLENFRLRSWVDAASVLWQVARTCATAEEGCQFEHRDLHWGNVLVQSVRPSLSPAGDELATSLASLSLTSRALPASTSPLPLPTPRKKYQRAKKTIYAGSSIVVDPAASTSASALSGRPGVKVTLIDFTLSRARNGEDGDSVLFDAFEDECIFEGDGDYQFDIYRAMKLVVGGDWERFEPFTNLLWLHYLSRKLLFSKKLKPPSSPSTTSSHSHLAVPPTPSRRRTTASLPRSPMRPPPHLVTTTTPQDVEAERTAYAQLVAAEQVLREALIGRVGRELIEGAEKMGKGKVKVKVSEKSKAGNSKGKGKEKDLLMGRVGKSSNESDLSSAEDWKGASDFWVWCLLRGVEGA